jgi:UDP-N-acetylglucosamine 2-epimerase (non-hydrolysing)
MGLRFLSVIGTRPQLVKLAPICDAFNLLGEKHEYIDTGQHYDEKLARDVQLDLDLPDPIVNLSVGSHSHAKQTALIMQKLEIEIDRFNPDTVLVYGDTNSTLAATLVAVKKNIRVAHIEAGLRSRNKKMPEELNRIATDHLSDILFCPTETSLTNLKLEGLESRSFFVGDVMADLILRDQNLIKKLNLPEEFAGVKFLVLTLHRAENTDSKERLGKIFKELGKLKLPIILFAHPRLLSKLKEFQIQLPHNMKLKEPVPHNLLMAYLLGCSGVVTDSGGLQKEAFILKVPCTTIRTETEWPETLIHDWNVLVTNISDLGQKLNIDRNKPHENSFGDGLSAIRTVKHLTGEV